MGSKEQNISNFDVDESPSLPPGDGDTMKEFPERPPTMTTYPNMKDEVLTDQDAAQYLKPRSIKLRRFTLKKW